MQPAHSQRPTRYTIGHSKPELYEVLMTTGCSGRRSTLTLRPLSRLRRERGNRRGRTRRVTSSIHSGSVLEELSAALEAQAPHVQTAGRLEQYAGGRRLHGQTGEARMSGRVRLGHRYVGGTT
jgi:hypothetical protein